MKDSYLVFMREDVPGRKTARVWVTSKRSGSTLGQIAWHGPWRQYCFWPERNTLFNVGCMDDIKAKIGELMAERRK
jgi:hypothetical protein